MDHGTVHTKNSQVAAPVTYIKEEDEALLQFDNVENDAATNKDQVLMKKNPFRGSDLHLI